MGRSKSSLDNRNVFEEQQTGGLYNGYGAPWKLLSEDSIEVSRSVEGADAALCSRNYSQLGFR